MPSVQVDISPLAWAALQMRAGQVNRRQQLLPTLPTITPAQIYLEEISAPGLLGITRNFQGDILDLAALGYQTASPDNRAIVLAKVGLSSAILQASDAEQVALLRPHALAVFPNLSAEDQATVFAALGLAGGQ